MAQIFESGRGPGLSQQTLPGALVGGDVRRQKLDSHFSAELLVLGQIDLAHAAAPELPDDQVVRDGLANHGLADR